MRTMLMVLGFVVVGCGPSQIPLGQPFSDTLTSMDSVWTQHLSDGETLRGYYRDYVVQVKAGFRYTVVFGSNTGHGSFEDEGSGNFLLGGGVACKSFGLATNPRTVTWIPAETGLNKVDVNAQTQNVPLTFTVEITPQ